MNDNLKTKLEKLEAKIQTVKGLGKNENSVNLLLLRHEYACREIEMSTATPEEAWNINKEAIDEVVQLYAKWLKMTPEEQKLENERSDRESEKDLQTFMIWYNSPERLAFDEEYSNRNRNRKEDKQP
jgi:hypothetical protein